MQSKRRQIAVPSKRPAKDLDAVENRLRALHGEARNTRSADLYQLLERIAQDNVTPAMLARARRSAAPRGLAPSPPTDPEDPPSQKLCCGRASRERIWETNDAKFTIFCSR